MTERLPQDFLAESEELIEALSRHLRELEAGGVDVPVRPEVVNAVFRAAHTLKGMARMVGLDTLGRLSHMLEELLDALRKGKIKPTRHVYDVLWEATAMLRTHLEAISAGRERGEEDEAVLHAMITSLLAEQPQGPPPALEQCGFDPQLLKVFTEYEVCRIWENMKARRRLYQLKACFPLETFDTGLSELNAKVQEIGEIITTLPSPDPTSEEMMAFCLIVGTHEDQERLVQHLAPHMVDVTEIGYRREGVGIAAPVPPASSGHEAVAAPRETASATPVPSVTSTTPTVRVEIAKLDALTNLAGEMSVAERTVERISTLLMGSPDLVPMGLELRKAATALARRARELQDGLIEARMVPISQLFERLATISRKLARELGKQVRLTCSGGETRLDKALVEALADPLLHLIRNAMDHAIEHPDARVQAGKPSEGMVRLRAYQHGPHVVIEVEDDGRGIDLEVVRHTAVAQGFLAPSSSCEDRQLINLLFQPGFSTAREVTELSGRGVGLDVVAQHLSRLNGLVDVETVVGQGTRFTLTLPATQLIVHALLVKVRHEQFAIPLPDVREVLRLQPDEIETVERREFIQRHDRTLPLLYLDEALGLAGDGEMLGRAYVVVVGRGERRAGLVVDAIAALHEVVLQSLGEYLAGIPGFAGATTLESGETILVIDVAAFLEEVTQGVDISRRRGARA